MERTVTRTQNDTADDVVVLADSAAPRSRIRWAAVFAGMVLSVGLLILLSSLWLAIAYGSDEPFVVRNLAWFVGASAVGCLLIGGFLAGRLSGVPGAGTGLAHGLTLWALTLLVVLAIGIPSVINVLNLGRVATELQPTTSVIASGVDSSLWATFIAMVGALVAAGIGGMIGGASQRRRDHVEDLDRR